MEDALGVDEALRRALEPVASPPVLQDEAEVVRWFAERRTVEWMCAEYERRYNVVVTPAFLEARLRAAVTAPGGPATDLVPWVVEERHRWAYPLALLRLEARRRAGSTLTPHEQHRLAVWKDQMVSRALVVAYDPHSEDGFRYVERQPGDGPLVRP